MRRVDPIGSTEWPQSTGRRRSGTLARDGSFPIVGVAGSAGALSAFQERFRGLLAIEDRTGPAEPGSPDSESSGAGKMRS